MTSTNSTITPSTQILEAARKAQALADAGKALKPFLPQDSRETVEGVEKVANALKATGEAMKHFGFDEAEPEPFDAITGQKTGQKAVQADAMTGYSLNNADSGSLFLFPNPDDGIMDGYLNVIQVDSITGKGEFNTNPETLSPLNIDTTLVTDAYQHQDVPGADLIGVQPKQGTDPYQAQDAQYAVLA